MLGGSVRYAADAIVTVAQYLYPQAVIYLERES